MKFTNRKDLSLAIAQLMPHIIQGAHLGFLANRTITHTQFFVLVAIHSNGPCAMKTLSENMKVSMPTISGIVKRLVAANYVTRSSGEADRRQVKVELTKEGRKFIARFQQVISERWQEVLKSLNQDEINTFNHVVLKLYQTLQMPKEIK